MNSIYPILVLGISKNDWGLYEVDSFWFSDDPAETPPSYFTNINHTEWRLEIEEVHSETVKFSLEKQFNNGSSLTEIHEGNVRTGEGNLSLWLIRGNLNAEDLLYTNQNLTVNSTGSYDFAGATRDGVYGWDPTYDEEARVIEAHGMFWDRETGILCGSIDEYIRYVDSNVSSTIFTRLNIVDTSLWESQPSTSFFNSWWFAVVIAIAVFIGVLIVSVAFLLWRKRKFKRHQTGRRQCLTNRRLFRKPLIGEVLIYTC
jgi:hypothetical protein